MKTIKYIVMIKESNVFLYYLLLPQTLQVSGWMLWGAILSSPQSRIIIERVNTSSVLTIRTPIKMITFLLLLIEGSARAQYLR